MEDGERATQTSSMTHHIRMAHTRGSCASTEAVKKDAIPLNESGALGIQSKE